MKIRLFKENKILLITTTAMLVAIGVLLPQVFHSIPNAGTLISPMHLPVLLCGLICGGLMGGLCGLLTPILSCLIFGMPPFPNYLVPMAFELTAYGLLAGIFMEVFSNITKTKKTNYILALVCSMVGGRIVYCFVKVILFSIIASDTALNVLIVSALTGAFVSGWLGIIIQIVFIPAIMFALQRAHVLEKYDISYSNVNSTQNNEQ